MMRRPGSERGADGNWRTAFEVLDRVCLRLAEERLPRQGKPTPADRELVRQLLSFYEDFVRENGSDPAVRYEAARAYLRVGDLCRRLLGRHRAKAKCCADAATAFGESLALLERLAEEFPDRPDCPGSAGDTLANFSQMARDQGEMIEGRRLWQEALKKYRVALDIDPNADRYREKIRREFGTQAEQLDDIETPNGSQ